MQASETPADPKLLASLHPVLRAIVVALGIARTEAFLMRHGGTFVKLPKTDGRRLDLSDKELAALRHQLHQARLDKHLPSHLSHDDCISLPKADKLFLKYRNDEMRLLRGQQVTLNQLAVRFNLTSRQVQNILRGGERVEQGDLFMMLDDE